MAAGALAELGKADVAALTQFQAGGDHDAVNIDADLALEFKQHIHGAGIACSAAEDPSATAQDCAGEGLDQARGFFDGDGLHLHGPGNAYHLSCVAGLQYLSHSRLIGEGERSITIVAE